MEDRSERVHSNFISSLILAFSWCSYHFVGMSRDGVTALWSLSRHIYPSLVLVQPRKTRPYITERLLIGRKESNQSINREMAELCLPKACLGHTYSF